MILNIIIKVTVLVVFYNIDNSSNFHLKRSNMDDNIISDEVKSSSSSSSSSENEFNEKVQEYNDTIKKLQTELLLKVIIILKS